MSHEHRTKRVLVSNPSGSLKSTIIGELVPHHPKSMEGNKKAVHDFHMEHYAHHVAKQKEALEKKTHFQKEHAKECLSHPHEINAYETRMDTAVHNGKIHYHESLADHHAHEATSPSFWDEAKG